MLQLNALVLSFGGNAKLRLSAQDKTYKNGKAKGTLIGSRTKG